MATLHMYKTYAFKDKDPIIDKLRTIIADEKVSYQEIHDRTDVSTTTLYGWFHGKTRRPQHPTVMAVVRGLGYDYQLVKVGEFKPAKRKIAAATSKSTQKKF